MNNVKKVKSAEAQIAETARRCRKYATSLPYSPEIEKRVAEEIPQPPSEEDFVGLVKYLEEREKNLSKYSDKLRQSLQRVFDVFGDPDFCQICSYSADNTRHVKFRDEQGYLHGEETSIVNEQVVTYAKNKDYLHEFKAKIRISEEIEDVAICMETRLDGQNFEQYKLVTRNDRIWLQGRRNCEMDATGVTTWLTIPEGTQRGGTPSRTELKQLVRSCRLPKFLAYASQKLAEDEQEYKAVAEAAEKMAASLQ